MDKNSVMQPIKMGRPDVYPFKTMEVGESFFFSSQPHSMRMYAYQQNQRLSPKKFRVGLDEGNKHRVWRVK